MAEPLVILTHCPVCGKPHSPTVIVLDDQPDAVLSNETCNSCWMWFRMQEFCLTLMHGDAFDPKWCAPNFRMEVAHA